MSATQTQTRTNSQGFPIVDCPRCGGTGRFGPVSVEGGRCFSCLGTGVAVKAGKARKAWVAYLAAQPSKHAVVCDLKVGDKVLPDLSYRKLAGMAWTAVTSIEVTTEVCGSTLIGTDEADRVFHYYTIVTLENGFSRKLSAHGMVRRCVTAEMVPDPRDFWP